MALPACRKATPVLYVETIAPSLAFWRDRLGSRSPPKCRARAARCS